jgi:hypothetical protein
MTTLVAAPLRAVVSLALAALMLAACGLGRSDPPPAAPSGQQAESQEKEVHWIDRPPEHRSLLGDQGIFGPGGALGPAERPPGEENLTFVNPHLWRAALDVVSFMPLANADPFGGVVITDWYSPPESPDERFKLNVFILSRELRADALRVSVFREQRDGVGWNTASVNPGTARDVENRILTQARRMRIAAQSG